MKPETESFRCWGEQMIPDRLIPWFILQGSISRYLWAAQFVEGKVVLDVGCGSGYGTSYLRSKGAKLIAGGDISPESVTYAREHYKSADLHFILLDAQNIPCRDDSFDVVISFELIEHVEKYEDFISECSRVLRNDGIFICSTPNKETASPESEKPLARYHCQEFYANELYDMLVRHFKDVGIYGMDPQNRGNRIMYKLATMLEPMIFSIPNSHLFTNLLTKFIFKRYYLIRMSDLDSNLERIPIERYQPYAMQDSLLLPGDLIATGRSKKV